MKIITICGSMKYINEMFIISEELELEGNVVLMPIYNPNKPNKDSYTKEEIKILDKMHRERIKLSNAIFVVNIENYIGKSTKSEIDYAKSLGKEIIYYMDKKN